MNSAFSISLPRDTDGRLPRGTPAGLPCAIEAFEHARRLQEMKGWGMDEDDMGMTMMLDKGFEMVAEKLRLAAERTETTPQYTDDDSGDETLPNTDWYQAALFYSFPIRESSTYPDVDDVQGWLALMKRGTCAWETVWAAYCVAQMSALGRRA
ncbi:hypothetical protein IAR55_003275 [Kwoniella newhampshirensis]|uniref:Uncharacterized protein n=1 Tax=Kwoniella newhampshirensis TaxID=1651941 RepID=A0AAW0YYS9_9TREE